MNGRFTTPEIKKDKKSVYIPSWTCYNTNLNIGKG